jgi:hypothetical protein
MNRVNGSIDFSEVPLEKGFFNWEDGSVVRGINRD